MRTSDLAGGRADEALPITELDIDRAVGALRRELALRALRRRLLDEELDARTALALSERALEIQVEPAADEAASRLVWLLRLGVVPRLA